MGVELTGRDLLDFTPESARSSRRRRFENVAYWPCGVQTRIPMVSGHGLTYVVVGVLLPVIHRNLRVPMVICLQAGEDRETLGRDAGPSEIRAPMVAAYFDIGAGLPECQTDPEALWPAVPRVAS
jgi:hypothetical protein